MARIIVFDVNEIRLDMQTLTPLFERIFGGRGPKFALAPRRLSQRSILNFVHSLAHMSN